VRFLADESCDLAVVRALRATGHDVTAVAEFVGGADDPTVADLAVAEHRVLLTEDKDFGQLVYAAGHAHVGVMLIRFPAGARRGVGAAVLDAVRRFGERLIGAFSVVEPGRVRLGRPPRG
jgi:predicted nuclease of predicted toxin-antitoxin system